MQTLRKNRELVSTAVLKDPSALQHADLTFKNDLEFVLLVVRRQGSSIEYVHSVGPNAIAVINIPNARYDRIAPNRFTRLSQMLKKTVP